MSEVHIRRSRIGSSVGSFQTTAQHLIALGPGVLHFLEMEDALFHHNSAVMMPVKPTTSAGDQGVGPGVSATNDGLDAIKSALIHVEANPEQVMLVAGHTDTSGEVAFNIQLSELRARNVLAALLGKRDDWVKTADDRDKVEDHKQILKWVAERKGFPCDPGAVNNVKDANYKPSVRRFQESFNAAFGKSIGVDGDVGKETLGAFFDVYEDQLLEIMFIEPAKLQQIRDGIQFLDPRQFVGCGEHKPIEEPLRDAFRSAANRRVELLFFDPDERPPLPCHPAPKSCNHQACKIYDLAEFRRLPLPVTPTPVPGPVAITIVKVETTDPNNAAVFHADDDFSPFLGEKARIHVRIENLRDGFTGKLRMEIGRLNNTPDDAATEANEAFTLTTRLEVDVTASRGPLVVVVEWDGKTTQAAAAELSSRQTPDHANGGALQNIPLDAIASGSNVTHGLYHVDNVSIHKDANRLARQSFSDVVLSVPILVNLTFNARWATDLAVFGLTPFRARLEESLRRFGGRDYMIRDATLGNRVNVRFFSDPAKGLADTLLGNIGGFDATEEGLFGQAPGVNIYAHADTQTGDIEVFPRAFITFNNDSDAADQRTFRQAFQPLGVQAAQTHAAPGTAAARSVAAGAVTGATSATDFGNVIVVLSDDGLATVASTNTTVVPAARATDIQRAYNTFVKMVGNTTNHEVAHTLGIASRNRALGQVVIGGTTLRSPLPDTEGHNPVSEQSTTNIVDRGSTRTFRRRVEAGGSAQQRFSPRNTRYLRDCIPFAPADR